MVICLERGADLHMTQLMPLPLTVYCFCKIQIGFTFLVPAHQGSPRQRAVKWLCVVEYVQFKHLKCLNVLISDTTCFYRCFSSQGWCWTGRLWYWQFVVVPCFESSCYLLTCLVDTWLHFESDLGPNLQDISRFVVDYIKFIVRSTYDSDLERGKTSLKSIINQFVNTVSDDLTIFASESYPRKALCPL